MEPYQTSIPVHYYEINNHRQASPVAILNYLEEAAIRHSESVGWGIEKLLANSRGWLLTRWSLHMQKYPQWGETVNIETWPYKFERFYATREFRISDREGRVLGAATTLWVFFDLRRKRPVRIPPDIYDAYGTGAERMVADEFADLPVVDEPEIKLEFRVRLSDIDTNDHVNNTKYVEWLLETVPLSVHNGFLLSSVEIAYKKETSYGSTVLCGIKETEAGERQTTFLHIILDKDSGTELARARTVWQKRSKI
ncbi:acyl-[acyl-carrier-protein] thioesterase [Thermincola potens]|uniref:Acyl-ACP thioesterase n=1 Tax=Thermincola potens (strain JR) TaxID=635013 RepID=D5XAN2_THEPJ|nr:acyl-ACP thioesterase domain-containing protein [Thermincola potens]ADG83236.1 acyl-ACP thioesterase [Thermincola potens JR]